MTGGRSKVNDPRGNIAVRETERREGPRYAIAEGSALLFTGDGSATAGRLVDLSQDGCRVQTSVPVFSRAWFPVEVFFQTMGEAFRFSGIVHWTSRGNLLGVRFVNAIPERMVALAKVICRLEEAAPARKVIELMTEQEPPTAADQRSEWNT
jgi:PilZ domain-containing protein